jgi:hypothetical protein
MQVPAYITGTVQASGHPVPGALVVAAGKDGVHQVRADGAGGYHISLLVGEWSLSAALGPGQASGPVVRLHLQPSQQLRVVLQAP